jgi:hypothetical protein
MARRKTWWDHNKARVWAAVKFIGECFLTALLTAIFVLLVLMACNETAANHEQQIKEYGIIKVL